MQSADELSALAETKLQKMVNKLNRLYHQLKRVIAPSTLRKALMGTALALGITTFATGQTFSDSQVNPFGIIPPNWGFASLVDIDGDGDLDIMSASYDYYSYSYFDFQFFENTGNATSPTFAAGTLNVFGLAQGVVYNTVPTFADMDNDGDLDMFAGGIFGEGIIRYYENIGTADAPMFAPGVDNPFNIDINKDLTFPSAADLDGDGDIDLMATSEYGVFNYWENVGTVENPSFAALVTNPFGITLPSAVDII
ncbi:MAG: FG-GAP-like repeat-containing protein, partial [Bacteroidota bacterium]